ncbi:site-specific integrase [Christensenellaceae bacterium OttesenSCG-928-K19]|nr:site-specific integrase [Christensenellaceae bacterium OttesenSCG-928-K19]
MAKRSNGEGQLRHRKDGRWELSIMVGYNPDGSRRIKSFYGKTQKEVKEKFEVYKKDKAIGLDVENTLIFGEWADMWYKGHKNSVSATTYDSYRYTLTLLKETFGSKFLKDIKPMHVEQFLIGLRNDGKSDSYLSKCRGMLYQIFHKAEANDLILKNPVRFAEKMKRITAKKKKDAFTKEEIQLLQSHLPNDRMGNTILLMIATGMRSQEVVALQQEHIESDGSMLYIRQAQKLVKGKAVIGPPKSADSVRDIPVPEEFRKHAIYLRGQAKEFVWDGSIPGVPYNLRNFREKYKKAMGDIPGVRPLTPHCCRHTYVTQMQSLGVDMEVIKELSGHAEIDMTEKYLHIQREAKEQAAKRFSEAFEQETEKEEE